MKLFRTVVVYSLPNESITSQVMPIFAWTDIQAICNSLEELVDATILKAYAIPYDYYNGTTF